MKMTRLRHFSFVSLFATSYEQKMIYFSREWFAWNVASCQAATKLSSLMYLTCKHPTSLWEAAMTFTQEKNPQSLINFERNLISRCGKRGEACDHNWIFFTSFAVKSNLRCELCAFLSHDVISQACKKSKNAVNDPLMARAKKKTRT